MKKLNATEMRKVDGGFKCKKCGGSYLLYPIHIFSWKHQQATYNDLFK